MFACVRLCLRVCVCVCVCALVLASVPFCLRVCVGVVGRETPRSGQHHRGPRHAVVAVTGTRRGQSHCQLHRRDARHVATSQRLDKGEGRRIERHLGRVHRTSEREADVPVPRQRREQGRR